MPGTRWGLSTRVSKNTESAGINALKKFVVEFTDPLLYVVSDWGTSAARTARPKKQQPKKNKKWDGSRKKRHEVGGRPCQQYTCVLRNRGACSGPYVCHPSEDTLPPPTPRASDCHGPGS